MFRKILHYQEGQVDFGFDIRRGLEMPQIQFHLPAQAEQLFQFCLGIGPRIQ